MSTISESSTKDMSMPEREQWLMDRGVQIEKSDDASKVKEATARSDLSITDQIRKLSLNNGIKIEGVKFVYIPHDTSKPISEVTLPSRVVESLGPSGDLLPAYVKSFFADGKTIDDHLFREQAQKQNLMGGGTDEPLKVSSQAMMNATLAGSVETFPLVRPSSTNKHQGVYIYLDEVGMLKNLPLNFRASKIAGQCGYNPEPKFYGDIFIGRVETKPSHFMHNINIKAEDVINASSDWIVNAPRENLEWTKALDDATGGSYRKNHQSDVSDGTDGVAVQVEKDGAHSFSWLQNSDEIEVTIPLLSNADVKEGKIAYKKLIKTSFLRKKVIVKYDGRLLLELDLYEEIDIDGCTWTLDKDNLVITCEKFEGGKIWPRIE
eukprot:scaffold40235_cov49-Cyclotella_meneghiniana.AAC.8